jgi:hypothetical protein
LRCLLKLHRSTTLPWYYGTVSKGTEKIKDNSDEQRSNIAGWRLTDIETGARVLLVKPNLAVTEKL